MDYEDSVHKILCKSCNTFLIELLHLLFCESNSGDKNPLCVSCIAWRDQLIRHVVIENVNLLVGCVRRQWLGCLQCTDLITTDNDTDSVKARCSSWWFDGGTVSISDLRSYLPLYHNDSTSTFCLTSQFTQTLIVLQKCCNGFDSGRAAIKLLRSTQPSIPQEKEIEYRPGWLGLRRAHSLVSGGR